MQFTLGQLLLSCYSCAAHSLSHDGTFQASGEACDLVRLPPVGVM
jgi:hypothetical protein